MIAGAAEPMVTLPDGQGWVSFVIAPEAHLVEFELDVTYGEMSKFEGFHYNWTDPFADDGWSTPHPSLIDVGGIGGRNADSYIQTFTPTGTTIHGPRAEPTPPTTRTTVFEWDLGSPRGYMFFAAGNASIDAIRVLSGTVLAAEYGNDAGVVDFKELDGYNARTLDARLPFAGVRRLMGPTTVQFEAERPFFAGIHANAVKEPDGTRVSAPYYMPWAEGSYRESFAGTYVIEYSGTEAGDIAYWYAIPKFVTAPLDYS